MDYDKQKALTKKQIENINLKGKGSYFVNNISTYPQDNKHVEISWLLPIKITRNEDEFWFNGYEESNIENYWVVYSDKDGECDFELKVKQFEKIEDAINYATGEYKKWLQRRIDYLNLFA